MWVEGIGFRVEGFTDFGVACRVPESYDFDFKGAQMIYGGQNKQYLISCPDSPSFYTPDCHNFDFQGPIVLRFRV